MRQSLVAVALRSTPAWAPNSATSGWSAPGGTTTNGQATCETGCSSRTPIARAPARGCGSPGPGRRGRATRSTERPGRRLSVRASGGGCRRRARRSPARPRPPRGGGPRRESADCRRYTRSSRLPFGGPSRRQPEAPPSLRACPRTQRRSAQAPRPCRESHAGLPPRGMEGPLIRGLWCCQARYVRGRRGGVCRRR